MAWDIKRVTDPSSLFQEFLSADVPNAGFRGQSDNSWKLQPSLNRLAHLTDEPALIKRELDIAVEFKTRSRPFLDYLEQAFLGHPNDPMSTSAVAVLQHYGAPTRLLDWSYSPFVALFFAVVECPQKDGAVWSFSNTELTAAADKNWNVHGIGREIDNTVNLNAHAFKVGAADWFCSTHSPIPFQRMSRQHGFFTIAGRLNVDHGDKISHLVTSQPVRWDIPSSLEPVFLRQLKLMGLDSTSLGYMGADSVGREISSRFKL